MKKGEFLFSICSHSLRSRFPEIEKEIELKAELAKDENYSEQIEKYRAEIESIDKKLGVDKK